MKPLLNAIVEKVNQVITTLRLNKTAKELYKYSDSRLSDIGISRYLLLKGAAGYPWLETPRATTKVKSINDVTSIKASSAKAPTTVANGNELLSAA